MAKEISAERVLHYIRTEALRPQKYQEICCGLGIESFQQGELNQILGRMEKQGDIIRTRKDQYGLPEMMNIYRGTIRLTARGFGVVMLENDCEEMGEIFVLGRDLNGAMHEDKVMVRVVRNGYGVRRSEGEIIRILQRAHQQLVGTFQRLHRSGQVIPDDARQIYPIIVRGGKLQARQGEKVLVEITVWPGKHHDPEGRIIEIFGKSGRAEADLRMVIRKHELRDAFPLSVIEEAKRQAAQGVGESLAPYRRDLREELLITIDGEDAKDLDDAVSLVPTSSGWKLGVHIADVSHYVQPDTALDREAYARGTSVYLLDTVLPMLPQELCNGICSLNALEDRLAISCVMELDTKGRLLSYEIFHSLICVRERMTYRCVNELLAEGNDDVDPKYRDILPMLREMKKLADRLRKNRHARGALDFDFPEASVKIDAEGNPIESVMRERGAGEKLIEDFMIQANEVVAEHLFHQKAPILYRVHERPEQENFHRLKDLLKNFDCPIPKSLQSPKAWQKVLEEIKGKPFEDTVAMGILRSLRHADYRPEELGHFGLASEYYCHFTSPIRRYPDLIVHRTLSGLLRQTWNPHQKRFLEAHMKEWGEHCSLQERRAEEAERNLLDCKKIRYMKAFVGEVFSARIVNVQSFGFFVRLENTVEGLVHISTLQDDYYHYEEKSLTLLGSHTGKTFHIGDRVEVVLVRADTDALQMDFELYRNQKNAENRLKTSLNEKIKKGKKKKHEQKRKERKKDQKEKEGRLETSAEGKQRTAHRRRNQRNRRKKHA